MDSAAQAKKEESTEVGATKEEEDKKATDKAETDELAKQQELAEEEAMAEMMGSVFSTKRPKDFGAGLSSALKTMGKGVAMGAGLLIAAPIQGAREGGAGGFCKGLVAGIAGAVSIPAAAVAVGAVQIGRGIANTPNSIAQKSSGKEWDEQARKWITYSLSPFLSTKANLRFAWL